MLKLVLPWLLLPFVWWWARIMESRAMRMGRALEPGETDLARLAGVMHPEKIRIVLVDAMPMPHFPWFRKLAARWGLSMDGVIGLCLRYGIFLRRGSGDRLGTFIHECVHTAQCERLGGLAAFLVRYVRECLEFGYVNAPMEREAEEILEQLYARSVN